MALIKCPECGKEISDKSTNCIHCGYPLEHLVVVSKEEPKETRVVIQNFSKEPEKKDIAISIICDVTEMTQNQAKMLVEKDVIIVKENITLKEAEQIASRFISADINAVKYHSSIPHSWGCMTMGQQRKDDEFIKTIEKDKQRFEHKQKIEKEQKYKEYEQEVRERQKAIDAITEPKKPNYFLGLFEKEGRLLSILILIGPWITLLFCKIAQTDNILLLLYIVLGLIATPIWLLINYSGHKADVEIYKEELKLYNNNKEEWLKQKEQRKANIAQIYKSRADNEVEQKYAPAPKNTNKIKCPVCGSDSVERITTVDRGVSVAMVGLASGKIGKQYKCKKCKHMW